MLSQLRLRHPKGVSTIEVDLDNATVQDLQHKILSVSEIIPSQQDLKAGYPPHSLTIVPELPLASLGLAPGEQIIVTRRQGAVAPTIPSPVPAETRAPAISPPRRTQSTNAPSPSISSSGGSKPEHANTDAGVFVHRVVPDDNSCLFNSVALVFEQDIGKAQSIREIVADAIHKDPITWNEAILGRSPQTYIDTILKPSAWGGAIELAILAKHYATEIASVDVETGRIDRFTPSSPSPAGLASNRCILIYSGIHYDAATLAPMLDAPPDFHQTLFPVEGDDAQSDSMLRAASEIATKLRAKRAYTNTATFDLKCTICNKGLKGEKEARAHAMETSHTSFGEY